MSHRSRIIQVRLLKELYNQVVMAPSVKIEVVDKGKDMGAPEVAYVEQALQEGWVREAKLTGHEKRLVRQLRDRTGLDDGEVESLSLARSRRVLLLVDDKEARTVAAAMNVEHIGTAGALLEAFIRGLISYDALENAVRDLSQVTWLSPDVVADILRRAKEVRK